MDGELNDAAKIGIQLGLRHTIAVMVTVQKLFLERLEDYGAAWRKVADHAESQGDAELRGLLDEVAGAFTGIYDLMARLPEIAHEVIVTKRDPENN